MPTVKDNYIHMRVKKSDKDRFIKLAEMRDKTMSQLVYEMLDRACAREGIKAENKAA